MFEVHQPWDPLEVCVVGRSYPPEFYSWIRVPHVRNLFEKIARETEEDFLFLIKTLEKFNVKIIRPDLADIGDQLVKKEVPPMCPRDHMIMIGNCLYYVPVVDWESFYSSIKDPSWPDALSIHSLPEELANECMDVHGWHNPLITGHKKYASIFKYVKDNNVTCLSSPFTSVNGAETVRIGNHLFFGTHSYHSDVDQIKLLADSEFPEYKSSIINTGGHSDGTYCPVAPGLIISLKDVPTYEKTFPGWEVVYLPNQSQNRVKPFLDLKQKNQGRWWIPGFEYDANVVNVVETWLSHWTGYVEETVFDVNMLVIDPKNVIVFGYNEIVFKALERYGITPHIAPLRHRYFWDGGIHCVTLDLKRTGKKNNFF